MYESEDACNHGKDPTGILPLKQISQIEALSEHGNKKQKQRQYILIITVANWVKRSLERDSRSFIFSCENEDELEEWSIFLEFAKAKVV